MPRILLTAAVAVAAAVAVPSAAHGATLHNDGRSPHRILLQDERGETNLVGVEGTRSVVIHDLNAPITVAGVPTCMPLDANTVSCAAVRRVELDLGDGPDNVRVATPLPVSIDGGPGNDRYVAHATDWPSRVNFAGGIGLDVASYGFATAGVESVVGSQFADILAGSPRTVQLQGLDGDDRITGGTGEELLAGGRGNDRIAARDGAPDTVDCGGSPFDWAAVDLDGEASITGCAEIVSGDDGA